MNTSELLFGGPANGSSSPVHSSSFPSLNTEADGDVESLMSPMKPRSQEDVSSYTTPLRLGLNLGRSQSAAPETWEYGNAVPSSTKSERYRHDNGLFGRSGFFDEAEEEMDKESFAHLVRRPASTGVIGRRNESEDVDSILETLGLASLESSEQDVSTSYMGTAMGGIGSYKSPVKQSMMAKIREGGDTPTSTNNNESNNFFIGEERQSSSNLFANQGQAGLQTNSVETSGSSSSLQQQDVQYQYPAASDIPVSGYQPSNNFGSNNNGGPQLFPSQMNQNVQQSYQVNNQAAYQPQQNVYYQQPPQMHSQQQHHVGMVHGAFPQTNAGQPTVYHMSTATPYGYQQQLPPGVQMVQQVVGAPGGQPQYISIVPIQAPGGPPGGHTYSYVQYGGEGFPVHSQPVMAAPTYVMGPHGPIAIQNPAGAIPIHNMGYSPPVEAPVGTSPNSEGGLMPTSPQTPGGGRGMGKRPNGLSTPRGKRNAEKNAAAPSKLGPEAAILLNEIRAAKSRNQWSIHDIKGFIVEFCLDQNGSRFIQQRLEVADPVEKQAVMDEVLPAINDLLNDVFGNYVVQKLFEFGTESLLKDLKGALEGNMLKLSLQMYGCRVTQKALESLAYDDLCSLLHEFDQNVLTCIQDQNGNHVMQKIVEVMSISAKEAEAKTREDGLADAMAEKIQFVVDDVLANVQSLCCHPYGCRVLQRMLEHCVDFQKTATLDEIQLCHKTLMDDQYGNYVIQHVLQFGRDSDRDSLLQIIVDNDLLKLSRQKFASNVVEKLLKYGNSAQRNTIVREMLKVVREGGSSQEGVGSTVLLLMVRDAYANYVVQTAIDVVPEGKEKQMLLNELKANEAQLRNYTFAKHIVAKLGSK